MDQWWQIDAQWWEQRPVSRIYHRVTLEDGMRLKIFR